MAGVSQSAPFRHEHDQVAARRQRRLPAGTRPGTSAVSSWHGVLHEVCGSAAFLALVVVCVMLARCYRASGQRGMAACSLAAGVLCAAGVASGGAPHGSLSLFAGVSIALLWVGVVPPGGREPGLSPPGGRDERSDAP